MQGMLGILGIQEQGVEVVQVERQPQDPRRVLLNLEGAVVHGKHLLSVDH
jgi:hypothetical protein